MIVGGVAGGASAAARARRVDESAEIHIFERGPYISFANCGLPYFIGGEIQDRARLLIMTPEKMWARSRVHAHVNHEVLAIDRAAKTIRVKQPDGAEIDVTYDRLILSQGAKPIVPPIPGAELSNVFTLRDVPDMDRIVAFLETERPRTVVVIGGGFIGLEMAEAFHRRGLEVTVIEKFPHILPLLDDDMASYLQDQIRGSCFDLKTSAEAVLGTVLAWLAKLVHLDDLMQPAEVVSAFGHARHPRRDFDCLHLDAAGLSRLGRPLAVHAVADHRAGQLDGRHPPALWSTRRARGGGRSARCSPGWRSSFTSTI